MRRSSATNEDHMNSTDLQHDWFRERLEAYLAGGLTAEERRKLEAHAAMCAACDAVLAEARKSDAALCALFAEVVPTDLEEKRIAYDDVLRYPPNWPEISEVRDKAVAETTAKDFDGSAQMQNWYVQLNRGDAKATDQGVDSYAVAAQDETRKKVQLKSFAV